MRIVKRHEVIQPQDHSIKLVPLTRGLDAIVDADDFEKVSAFNWVAGMRRDGKAYAYCSDQKFPAMHRLVVGNPPKEFWVDHINCNTLDNRKSNLRLVTAAQSNMNRTKRVGSKTKYKGVGSHPNGKFKSTITVEGKGIHLGYFFTQEEAARRYDEEAKKRFGEFAHLNFPLEEKS